MVGLLRRFGVRLACQALPRSTIGCALRLCSGRAGGLSPAWIITQLLQAVLFVRARGWQSRSLAQASRRPLSNLPRRAACDIVAWRGCSSAVVAVAAGRRLCLPAAALSTLEEISRK